MSYELSTVKSEINGGKMTAAEVAMLDAAALVAMKALSAQWAESFCCSLINRTEMSAPAKAFSDAAQGFVNAGENESDMEFLARQSYLLAVYMVEARRGYYK